MISAVKNHFAPLRLYARYFSTPRARNDYSTHIPILIGLAKIREIRHVLELGCGYYSTLTFLNRSVFPHLKKLQSVENDVSWAETIQEVAREDERWTLKLIDGEIGNSISDLDLESFDLILIDDSKTSAQRAVTIRSIARWQPERPWIVIHDYEVEEYRRAATEFKHRYTFKAYNPQTGIVCNKAADVKQLGRILKENRNLEPNDLERWLEAFSSEFKL